MAVAVVGLLMAPPKADPSVSMHDLKFDPATIEIKTGETIKWTNNDDRDHTVVSKDNFKSGNLSKGDTFEHTFAKAGKFNYACSYHPRMKAVVIVAGE